MTRTASLSKLGLIVLVSFFAGCISSGAEIDAERAAAGLRLAGSLQLEAYRGGGQVGTIDYQPNGRVSYHLWMERFSNEPLPCWVPCSDHEWGEIQAINADRWFIAHLRAKNQASAGPGYTVYAEYEADMICRETHALQGGSAYEFSYQTSGTVAVNGGEDVSVNIGCGAWDTYPEEVVLQITQFVDDPWE